MHDTEFFKKLVENIVMWSFVIVIAALALTILGLPLYLALTVDWKFALIYLLYPVVLMVMAALADEDRQAVCPAAGTAYFS